MKLFSSLAALGALAAGLFSLSLRGQDGASAEIGKPAPEINGKAWLNQLGAEPTIASLRGSAVMLEFWATW